MQPDAGAPFVLPLEQVWEDGSFNIRLFYGDIDGLAVQLMTEGQREPIKVRQEEGRYFIVDGHRRQRAFARARSLRIERLGERYFVWEGDRTLREAPGPASPDFDSSRVLCLLVDPRADSGELFASQLIYNSGKPLTLLERMIFVSRLARQGSYPPAQLALKTGFSRTHLANALQLNAADPRLLEFVADGRLSQKLALRLLRSFSPPAQMAEVAAAMASAERRHRDKVLPKDFRWSGAPQAGAEGAETDRETVDPVRARLHGLMVRMGDALRFAPNPAAHDRLATLDLINRYAQGKLPYARIEAHLLGRE